MVPDSQVSFSVQNLSVVVVVVSVVVNFLHFHLLFQNHWANFNQTWHKASLGEGDSSLLKWRAPHPCDIQVWSNENLNHWIVIKLIMCILFSKSMLWYNHMCLLIWTVLSGERCGPWGLLFFLMEYISLLIVVCSSFSYFFFFVWYKVLAFLVII